MIDLVYESRSYKEVLNRALGDPRFPRGSRTRLAQHLGVQPSFVSRVLTGDQDFSAEHVVRCARFLDLNEEEEEYFLMLFHRDRAGSAELRAHYQRQIAHRNEKRQSVRQRLKADRHEISEADALRYYGAWYHVAVHMYLRIPGVTLGQIAAGLRIPHTKVKESVALLEEIGMIFKERGRFRVRDQRMHNDRDSIGLRAHHANWRQASLRAWDEGGDENLFYSLVMSTDTAAVKKIRKILLEAIQGIDPVLGPSEDRELFAINLDLFRVSGE